MKEYKYTINGKEYKVNITEVTEIKAQVEVNGSAYEVEWEKPVVQTPVVKPVVKAAKSSEAATTATPKATTSTASGYAIKTPLPGVILDIKVNVGDTVTKGQTVILLEAMKMENNINADRDGKVTSIPVSKGDTVADGTILITIE